MFYCDPCRIKNNWPAEGLGPRSNGRCEACGKPALCHDVPSSALPKVERPLSDLDEYALIGARGTEQAPIGDDSPERSHAIAEITGDGPYDRRDRGKMVKPESGAPAGGYPGSLEQMGYPSLPEPKDPLIKVLLNSADEASAERKRLVAERIVAAAIQIEGVTISLPRPARHGTVLAAANCYLKTQPGQEVQGFLTSAGRFVNRIQARHIADIAGQNPGRTGGRDNPELYSEDLW